MRKYEVYLTTGETNEEIGDHIEMNETGGYLTIVDEYDHVTAMYVLANICGWYEVERYD